MKWIFLVSLCFIAGSQCDDYYITPNPVDRENCTVNGTTLAPCYTLQQIIDQDILTASSINLYLLSGTHVIPKNQTLTAKNSIQLVIQPWKEQKDVAIECQLGAYLYLDHALYLKLLSLHFMSCTILCESEIFVMSVFIENSIFENSVKDYAVVIEGGHVNASVFNCTFLSNNGAIYMHIYPSHDSYQINSAALIIHKSLFMNNSANAAISVVNFYSVIISASLFEQNSSPKEVIYLRYSNVEADNCNFTNNTAGNGLVYIAIMSTLKGHLFSNSIFHAMKEVSFI